MPVAREQEWAAGLESHVRAKQRGTAQGERSWLELLGWKEGQIPEMEPAPPQPQPSALHVSGSAFHQKWGKRGTWYVLRWKPSVLQLQHHIIPASGVMSSSFHAENASPSCEVVSLGGLSPKPALGLGSL